ITNGVPWQEDLASLRDQLLAKGLADDVPVASAFWDEAESLRGQRQHCDQADAAPGCTVEARYIYQVFRNTPKALFFAQALFGFELASADPRVAAVSLVGAEDNYIA